MVNKHKIPLNVLISPRFRIELSNKYTELKTKEAIDVSFSCFVEDLIRRGMEGL